MSVQAYCSRLVIYPGMAVSQCITELDDMIIIDVVDDVTTAPVNQRRLNGPRVTTSGYEAYAPEYYRVCAYHRSLLEAAHAGRALTGERPTGDNPANGRVRLSDALNRLASILAGWF